jgi:hypothetical protein
LPADRKRARQLTDALWTIREHYQQATTLRIAERIERILGEMDLS